MFKLEPRFGAIQFPFILSSTNKKLCFIFAGKFSFGLLGINYLQVSSIQKKKSTSH